jgi:2-dehydropantoate 2-reductase
MRVIVLGLGAVGGTVAAGLALAGKEVVGVARGAQLRAVQSNGLTLRTPDATHVAHFECVATPAEINLRPDDAIILTVKAQDTDAALEQLEQAGLTDQPIFCAQNGVENERRALRRFPNVHGITVMMPADFVQPGEVVTFGTPKLGIFDIGRFPGGADAADSDLADVLNDAGFAAFVSPTVMASKYGKLILNLRNIVGAALGKSEAARRVGDLLCAEGKAVLAATGIEWQDVGLDDPRRTEFMRFADVPGIVRAGSSTVQSLLRRTGSVETDFLNGEIILLGRIHSVPTPANVWFARLATRMSREAMQPGTIPLAEVERALNL